MTVLFEPPTEFAIDPPLRILITIPFDTLREYNPTIPRWTPSEEQPHPPGESDATTSDIANEVCHAIFKTAETEEFHMRLIVDADNSDGVALELVYDHLVNGAWNPRILKLAARRELRDGQIVMDIKKMESVNRWGFNDRFKRDMKGDPHEPESPPKLELWSPAPAA